MTRKAIATTAKPNQLVVHKQPGESPEQAEARAMLQPSFGAAVLATSFTLDAPVDLMGLIDALDAQCAAVHGGDMKRAESMLIGQAHSLEAIYTACARRAAACMGQNNLHTVETYLRLALKAQSQCRATLETLGAIKNPPVFAKQANIAHGHQQVNNGTAEPVVRAEEIEISQTELLEHDNGEQRMDTGTARTAGQANPAMATVEAIHRPTNARRKGQGKP